ncbi:hypothetical protein TNCV_3756001 [Trichonephila clavipes]|nr:hypothetical protein TNCV_3756001 [Trichonephila clavipes]
MWQRGLIGRTASAQVPSHMWSAFTFRREQLGSVSSTRERSVDIYLQSAFISRRERLGSVNSTRERSVDICSWLLPLDEKLYLVPSASVKNDLSKNVNNRIADDFYKSVNIRWSFLLRLPPALRSVIRFLAAKKKSAKEIHEELCQVYGEECMSSGMVRRWVRTLKMAEQTSTTKPVHFRSDETIAKVLLRKDSGGQFIQRKEEECDKRSVLTTPDRTPPIEPQPSSKDLDGKWSHPTAQT